MSEPDPLTPFLTESPASEVPIDNSVEADGSQDTGLAMHKHYERELDEYRTIFNKYMKNKPVKHDRVYVLIWTWEDALDDLKVREEVDRLENMFKDTYAFEVKRKELTSLEKASHQLNSFLSSFMEEHDESNTLLIFYYAGHGLYENGTVVFTGSTAQQNEEQRERDNVAWSSAEHNIKAKSADVLVIFDCCSAGGFGGYRSAKQPPFQCIAACGSRERTLKPGPNSFTSALIWALEQLRTQHPFTSRTLLEKIEEYSGLPKKQRPELLRRDEYNDAIVWIAPQKLGKNELVADKGELRNPSHEYLDLRFNFYRRLEKSDATIMAKCLSKLIHDNKDFQAKHIVLLDKTSTLARVNRALTSVVHKKRKRSTPSLIQSSTTLDRDLALVRYPEDILDSAMESLANPPNPKRLRLTDLRGEPSEPQSAFYHLRMALHYSLQSATSKIGRFADRIRPRSMQETSGDPSDID
ncbi:hypothetical protein EK21DRAFT_114122 [Setomelanomma holmii]|uniref:Peptidase C14 caspase domain-containing protein n=1 Tax=Setomelanomma holmii TaxID=210430 RepID=A0A9P4H4T6_9PLEO|nr:hypothetical protein EK21DRAFT_114122 [Setomelanomma holmii]